MMFSCFQTICTLLLMIDSKESFVLNEVDINITEASNSLTDNNSPNDESNMLTEAATTIAGSNTTTKPESMKDDKTKESILNTRYDLMLNGSEWRGNGKWTMSRRVRIKVIPINIHFNMNTTVGPTLIGAVTPTPEVITNLVEIEFPPNSMPTPQTQIIIPPLTSEKKPVTMSFMPPSSRKQAPLSIPTTPPPVMTTHQIEITKGNTNIGPTIEHIATTTTPPVMTTLQIEITKGTTNIGPTIEHIATTTVKTSPMKVKPTTTKAKTTSTKAKTTTTKAKSRRKIKPISYCYNPGNKFRCKRKCVTSDDCNSISTCCEVDIYYPGDSFLFPVGHGNNKPYTKKGKCCLEIKKPKGN